MYVVCGVIAGSLLGAHRKTRIMRRNWVSEGKAFAHPIDSFRRLFSDDENASSGKRLEPRLPSPIINHNGRKTRKQGRTDIGA